jgi:hypothetical protein
MKRDNSSIKVPNQRRLSRTGRKRQVEAGTANLLAHHAKADADTLERVEKFRGDLYAELGASPSCTRRALAEAVLANYACILQLQKELRKTRHKNRLRVAEHVSWATGQVSRLLKQLNLDARPRPRTLADLFPSKVPANPEIETANPAIPAESHGKPL